MFETAVFESVEKAPRSRVWTTLASFAMQIVGVGILVLMPFFFTQAIPNLRISEAPEPPHAPRRPEQVTKLAPVPPELRARPQVVEIGLVAPIGVPPRVDMEPDPQPPAIPYADDSGVENGIPYSERSSRRRSAIDDLIARRVPPPTPDFVMPRTTARPSVLLEGNLIRRVEPVYPKPALIARVQGQVTLHAIIDAEGRIVNLKATSGNPMLIAAAIDAVRQWRYRPYVLNNAPIEVETQITVNFTLR